MLRSGSLRRPEQFLKKHSSRRHGLVPGVEHQIFAAVRADNPGIVAGTDQAVGNGSQYARTRFAALVGVRTQDGGADSIIDAIGVILPPAAAVKAVIPVLVPDESGSFEGVPIPNSAVHGSG